MLEHASIDIWLGNLRRRDSTLPDDQAQAARGILSEIIEVAADQDVVREGDLQSHSNLLLEGLAFRYATLADGRRQVLAVHIPGDFIDLHSFALKLMDHSVATFTPSRFALAPHSRLRALSESHPHATRLLWLSTLIDAAILRQWLVGAAKRSAIEHTAHLICELLVRMELAGRTEGNAFALPVSQAELADMLGLTPVHTNRILQQLRARELIRWRGGRMEILDRDKLARLAEFDPTYLNLIDLPR